MEFAAVFRYLFLLGGVNALFFASLIIQKKNKSIADKLLAAWLVLLSFQLFIPFLYLLNENWYVQYSGYELIIFTLHPVFLYTYVRLLTNDIKTLKPVIPYFLLAVIPGLIIVYAIDVPIELKIRFLQGERVFSWPLIIGILSSLSFFEIFLFRCMQILRKHKRNVLYLFSYRQNVDLYWLWRLTYAFVLIYSIAMTLTIIFFIWHKPLLIVDYIYYCLLAIFIFLVGYFGWQQGNIFNSTDEIFSSLRIDPLAQKELISKEAENLKQFMLIEKPYLNQTLSIHQLSKQSKLPSNTISKILNRELNQNFFEFVNSYRIQHFKDLVKSRKFENYTLIAMAFECGFNSKASFNRVFKEQTGMTPGEYKKLFEEK